VTHTFAACVTQHVGESHCVSVAQIKAPREFTQTRRRKKRGEERRHLFKRWGTELLAAGVKEDRERERESERERERESRQALSLKSGLESGQRRRDIRVHECAAAAAVARRLRNSC
jgi:hypothetical protein